MRDAGASNFGPATAVEMGSVIRMSKDRDMKQTTPPSRDEVVKAVLSGASNARRLAIQFTAAVGDPQDFEGGFPEIASGGVVRFKELKTLYEDYEDGDLELLQGEVSASRMKALEDGASMTAAEKALYTRGKLAAYFAEPVDGAAYIIVAVTSSSGETVYWTEIREGYAWEGIERELVGIFPSKAAGLAALGRKGLMSEEDYRPRGRARGTQGRTKR